MFTFTYPLKIITQCLPNGWKIKIHNRSMQSVWFMDKQSFLYVKLLQGEPIIPIKVKPERRPVFTGFSMI